jgi:hypothetical protein
MLASWRAPLSGGRPVPESPAEPVDPVASLDRQVARLVAVQEIRDVIARYCRGIDRRQMELVRSCYHPDATDDHGDYRGGIDGFVDYLGVTLAHWQSTTHFLGNVLVEVGPTGTTARAESYALAFHRIAARGDKPERDLVGGIRYVDDFERREGVWRIAARVCVLDWSRTDPVAPSGWSAPATYVLGRADADDVVFADRLRDR